MDDDLLPPLNSGLTSEEWQQTPERVREMVKALWEKVNQLQDTVEKLREIVNCNSQGSSQPPSQDRPDRKVIKEKVGLTLKIGSHLPPAHILLDRYGHTVTGVTGRNEHNRLDFQEMRPYEIGFRVARLGL